MCVLYFKKKYNNKYYVHHEFFKCVSRDYKFKIQKGSKKSVVHKTSFECVSMSVCMCVVERVCVFYLNREIEKIETNSFCHHEKFCLNSIENYSENLQHTNENNYFSFYNFCSRNCF